MFGRAPTEDAASGPHAATLCSCSAPVSKLSGRRAKTLELILLPSPASVSAEARSTPFDMAAKFRPLPLHWGGSPRCSNLRSVHAQLDAERTGKG